MHPGVKPIEKPEGKRFPVRLLRGYFPADPNNAYVNGQAVGYHPLSKDSNKVKRGEVVELPIEEARDVLKRGIGERADQIPI